MEETRHIAPHNNTWTSRIWCSHSLFEKESVDLLLGIVTTLLEGSTAAVNTTTATLAERAVERKVDVLLAVDAHDERRDINDLLADAVGGERT
jgi:hypothetical protein